MSHYGSFREQWRMLQTVAPLFYSASLLPISDGVDDDDSGASDDVDRIHLQYAVTALRTDLKLSMLRQSYIDIDNDDLKVRRDSGSFSWCLEETFKALEILIDKEFPLMPGAWLHMMEATSGFGDLEPLVEGMFGRERYSVPSTSTHLATTKSLILFDDDNSAADEKKAMSNRFRENLKSFFKYIGEIGQPQPLWKNKPPRIRIAVLDSGVDASDSEIHNAIKDGQIKRDKSKTFIHKQSDTKDSWEEDTYGHGTKVTQLLLETAPAAEIFVCKISTGKVIKQEHMSGIAEAINWATSECKAHIISMSFGYQDHDDLIEKALENAVSSGKLIIAAASNNGALKGRSRPASREGVLCIHATDGLGNKGSMSPSPLNRSDNFATLGVAVSFHDKEVEIWKSGTSFATPIAVGFAAAVLEFARYREASGYPIDRSNLLNRKRGMEAIFRAMAEERDKYDFIHPLRIWGDKQCKHEQVCRCWREEGEENEIARVIQDALRDL